MEDAEVLQHIERLVGEEEALYAHAADGHGMDSEQQRRLRDVQVHLDQCWDLLRQRQARREYGEDPAGAAVRSAETVEGYTG
ncbi:MAG: DUF2630 family protein [Candidatus Dormibacteria bacterium]|jgi:hypothetical protein